MVTSENNQETTSKIRVDNLQSDKDAVNELTADQQKEIKGGAGALRRKPNPADPDEGGE